MSFVELHTGWTLHFASGPVPDELAEPLRSGIPATVPGTVHLDLLAAGLIPDPYDGDNEAAVQWIGLCDWEYRTSFDAPADSGVHELVADGIDTVATVELNGSELGRTANQHRGYRWPLEERLRASGNELRVRFRSAVEYAREREAVLGERPHSYQHPFNAIRKSACNFGWDWGPTLVTAGIWKRIGVETWSDVRIASVRPIVGVDGDRRWVDVHVALEWQPGVGSSTVTAAVAGVTASVEARAGEADVALRLETPTAELWWPRGYGPQARYDLQVTAGSASWTRRIGFRSVSLDVEPDADGSPFSLSVNGEPVFVRGANWIPEDVFAPRVTRDRLARRFDDATAAGMNLLRVWGGGLYESDDFYDLADEQGILVWQDFLLACAAYSEDPELWTEFEAEAREAVTRLTAHPSLVLWNGGNENIWGFVDWGWRPRLAGASWGERYYQELFPAIVAELAPGTPYSPGSPYGFSRYVHPNDPAHGTSHIWDVWNSVDYEVYRTYEPRFVSEFGFQGPPAWSTLRSVVHDEPADPYGAQMLVHQKANDGNDKLERGLGRHIAAPDTIDDWHWATQLNQARAVRFGIEHFRSLFPRNRGAIVWQLNDCWPVISWAAVDQHEHRKPLWHALAAAYADRLATLQPRPDGLALVLHNDSDALWSTTVAIRRIAFDGKVAEERTSQVDVAARAATTLEVGLSLRDPAHEVIVAELATGERAIWYGAEDPQLALDPAPLTAHAEGVPGGYRVRVTATSLAKDVTLQPDRVHPLAEADTALVTLLAGETAEFLVTAPDGLDPLAFTAPLVVRCANDLNRAVVSEPR